MKNYAAVLIAGATLALSASVFADHNSRFGDNTGRTVGGVHDNRIDNNTHSRDNRLLWTKRSSRCSRWVISRNTCRADIQQR